MSKEFPTQLSVEEAREEADKIQEKVKSGEAKDYNDAERRVAFQDKESLIVPVEKLIPGIKPAKEGQSYYQESREEGFDNDTPYLDLVVEEIRELFTTDNIKRSSIDKEQYEENKEILKGGLHGQIIVDLGSGNHTLGYRAAVFGEASGYIAVDKFNDPKNVHGIKEQAMGFRDDSLGNEKFIPIATVNEDMLEFLKRLPDNSVSILASGHTHLFGERYSKEVRKEIERVLHPEGFYINNDGITCYLNEEVCEKIYDANREPFSVFRKKSQEK